MIHLLHFALAGFRTFRAPKLGVSTGAYGVDDVATLCLSKPGCYGSEQEA